jgi:hypothetical protein
MISGRNATVAHSQDVISDAELLLSFTKQWLSDINHKTFFEIFDVLNLHLVVEES